MTPREFQVLVLLRDSEVPLGKMLWAVHIKPGVRTLAHPVKLVSLNGYADYQSTQYVPLWVKQLRFHLKQMREEKRGHVA